MPRSLISRGTRRAKPASAHAISRRDLLRGLGAPAVALPLLELTSRPRALAAGRAPQRYLVLFAGMSAGRTDGPGNQLQPASYGAAYPLTPGLQPLQKRGVANLVSVVSGLRMARSPSEPGGMGVKFHTSSMGPLLCGQAFAPVGTNNATPRPTATTSDQIVADSAGFAGKTPIAALHYRVQATTYGTNPERGIMSWRKVGGVMQQNAPTVNAQQAYQALVGGLRPTDPTQLAELSRQLADKRSAVDLALGKRSLLGGLGRTDRERLQRHLDELAALQQRLAASPDSLHACTRPAEPTDSTAIQDNYANEQQRWPLLSELIRTAFVCDQTRVATLCVTAAQSFLSATNLVPSRPISDCHNTSHAYAIRESFKEVIAWHVDIFASLVDAFRKTPDVDGRSLLDNTAMVYCFEGGLGPDPELGAQLSSHSTENMVALVAGRAAGRSPGQHIAGRAKHPASVLLTAMHNVGVTQPQLGEIGTVIDEITAA
jgi:hypothetical protein